MRRREASRAASVPPDPGRGNREAGLQLTKSPNPRDRAEFVHKKARASIGLVDSKPLTRRSIADILATAFPEHVIMATSTGCRILRPLSCPTGTTLMR